jgi:hypothetical protein
VNVGYLTQEAVYALREPGEYYDGDATRLELVVSAGGRRRRDEARAEHYIGNSWSSQTDRGRVKTQKYSVFGCSFTLPNAPPSQYSAI